MSSKITNFANCIFQMCEKYHIILAIYLILPQAACNFPITLQIYEEFVDEIHIS